MIEDGNAITNRLIKDARIVEGMSVLDLGCGRGGVSLLLAKSVGPSGHVVGIDRNDKVIKIARNRVKDENISNVNFLAVDLSNTLSGIGVYDAIVGRRILMYLPNPVGVLRKLSELLKEDGVVAFQEIDSTVSVSRAEPIPLHEKVNGWIWKTIEKEGANINMGFTLPSLLKESGFSVGNIKAEANIQGQKSHSPLVEVVRAMLHRIVEHGVADKAEIDIDSLEKRLKDERPESSIFISDLSFSVWGRKL